MNRAYPRSGSLRHGPSALTDDPTLAPFEPSPDPTLAGMILRKSFQLTSLLVFTLGTAGSGASAQIGAPKRIVTPDGSVFVLMQRKSRGLAWWASFVRMGAKHEGPGQRGLAEACAHASLAGTTTHGTSAPDAETEARGNLDTLRQSLHNARLDGRPDGEVAALQSDIDDARARVRNLCDPLVFRRLLSAIPATPPKITCSADGYLLESSLPSDRLGDFAILMAARRKDAVLRGYHGILMSVRNRLAKAAEAPGAEHRRALCLTALEVDPLRRVLLPPSKDAAYIHRAEALSFYKKHHMPGRTTTVIVGDFDPSQLQAQLLKTFVDARGSSAGMRETILEPQQNGPRTRVLSSTDPRLLWAWRPPDDARTDALQVLATWMQRRLEREFVRERALARSVEVHARFPSDSAPSPFTVEMTANTAYDFRQLELAAQKHFEEIEKNGPPAQEVGIAALTVVTEIRGIFEDPEKTAAAIANRVGRHPTRSLPVTVKTLEATAELSVRLFSESKRATVTTRPPAESEAGR